jgi:membrane associated rhomboid family serine protease
MNVSDTPATLLLIILNLLVSGYALYMDEGLIDRFSFRPRRILENREYYRLITAGFVHVGLAHLAFNMITLFFFGPLLEQALGTPGFLLVFFGSEVAAHGLSLAFHRNSPQYAAVGASGAVSGVLFGFILFEPTASIFLILFPIPIPAWLFAIAYVVLSIYAMRGRDAGMTGGIAHEAHIGGALAGLVLTILVEPRAVEIFLRQLGLG